MEDIISIFIDRNKLDVLMKLRLNNNIESLLNSKINYLKQINKCNYYVRNIAELFCIINMKKKTVLSNFVML